MRFRLKAFGLHLASSACALLLVLAALYLGWYRWPGWYLTGVAKVAAMMVGVDVILGPLLTLVVANKDKSTRELTRDIGIIVAVQLVALVYGTSTLWAGRPLFYAFSVNELQMTQASDIDPAEVTLAGRQNPDFAPHWYSLPRWVWAPLPDDADTRDKIVTGAVFGGGDDVIQMPRYFKSWHQGETELRKQLVKVDALRQFSKSQKELVKRRMQEAGFPTEEATTLAMSGRAGFLVAVFDPRSLQIRALLRPD
ncbi:MAG TPA: hypothetical protein VFO44_00080 [Steroidobacteraceae bacterium]|nr:hypothetical protein [Steroidobacteraceae bacterium]